MTSLDFLSYGAVLDDGGVSIFGKSVRGTQGIACITAFVTQVSYMLLCCSTQFMCCLCRCISRYDGISRRLQIYLSSCSKGRALTIFTY